MGVPRRGKCQGSCSLVPHTKSPGSSPGSSLVFPTCPMMASEVLGCRGLSEDPVPVEEGPCLAFLPGHMCYLKRTCRAGRAMTPSLVVSCPGRCGTLLLLLPARWEVWRAALGHVVGTVQEVRSTRGHVSALPTCPTALPEPWGNVFWFGFWFDKRDSPLGIALPERAPRLSGGG